MDLKKSAFVFEDRSTLKIKEDDFTYLLIYVRGIFKLFIFFKSNWLHVYILFVAILFSDKV